MVLTQSAATAASVGLGCGTCCGSGMGAVLSGYLITHAGNLAASLRGFLVFYLGKITAVMALCCTASVLGSQAASAAGIISGLPFNAVVDVFMICMGIWFLIGWVSECRGIRRSCSRCGEKSSVPGSGGAVSLPALWCMGAGYGISPCAPLLMMTGYAAALPVWAALTAGGVFALCSAVSPMLLLLLLTGSLTGRMHREIPQYLRWFRLGCYLLLLIIFSIDLICML